MTLLSRFGSLRRFFGKDRGARVRLAAASGIGMRGILTIVSIISLPMTIGYLGNEGYGLMLAVSSIIGWLQLSNPGIGASLQNHLTHAVATGDTHEQAELIATACTTLLVISAVLVVVGALVFWAIDWPKVFAVPSERFLRELNASVALVFAGFCLSMLLSFVSPILSARQEQHLVHVGSLVSGLSGLVLLVVGIQLEWGLTGVLAANILPSVAVNIAFAVWLLVIQTSEALRRHGWKFSWGKLRQLTRGSVAFTLISIPNLAFFQSDVMILTHITGLEAVAPYGVAQRAYSQLGTIFAIVAASLWVGYGHAKAVGDVAWIKRVYTRMRHMQALVFAAALCFMVAAGELVLRWWVGPEAAPDRMLIAALGAAFIAQQWTGMHANMLNGLNVLRPQLLCLFVNAALLIALSITGAILAGAKGLAVGACIAYAATSGWYLPLVVRRTLREVEAAKHKAASPELRGIDNAPAH